MGRFDRITFVSETGSTNDDMAKVLGEEHARGLTLVAGYQRRGAGRKGRAWIAPPGSALLCTIALPEPLPSERLWAVPFWIALAVRAALARFGIHSLLQWPNDVLIDGRKVAGILCISRVTGEHAWVACGVGVNVTRPHDDEAPAKIQPPPAFVSDFAKTDRDAVLRALLENADAAYGDLEHPERIVDAWNAAAKIPGSAYRIALDGEREPFDAIALRLLPGGGLLVKHGTREREISLADARVLRG